MELKLDYGPWETVFSGQVYGHEVEVAANPDHFYLVLIYEKISGKRVGAVIEGYKAFTAKGPMEAFLQTMPKTCFGIEKNFGERTSKLFFLSFEPFYSDFKQEDFERRIDTAVQKTDEGVLLIIDLARASSVELKELSVSPKSDYSPVLGDPFAMMAMVLGKKENQLTKMDVAQKNELIENVAPLIQLGLSKTREVVKEPAKNLYRAVIEGAGLARNYAAYILAENLLLENTPAIIIDDNNYYAQLGVVSPNSIELKEELVDFEPMAFPIKLLRAKENMLVSLKDADIIFILEMLGLKDTEFSKSLSLFCFAARANTVNEAVQKIKEDNEMPEYEKLRAERMLEMIEIVYPNFFGEPQSSDELVKTVPGRLGRAIIIDASKLNEEEKIIFTHTLIRQLTRASSSTQHINAALIAPNADALFGQNRERAVNAILRLENRGIGAIIGTENELPQELAQNMESKVSIVTGKDVAVSIRGKRNYRIMLRPSLSGTPKV